MKRFFNVVSNKKTNMLRAACKKAIDENLKGTFGLLMERIDPDDGPDGSYGALFGGEDGLVLAVITNPLSKDDWNVFLQVTKNCKEKT